MLIEYVQSPDESITITSSNYRQNEYLYQTLLPPEKIITNIHQIVTAH